MESVFIGIAFIAGMLVHLVGLASFDWIFSIWIYSKRIRL